MLSKKTYFSNSFSAVINFLSVSANGLKCLQNLNFFFPHKLIQFIVKYFSGRYSHFCTKTVLYRGSFLGQSFFLILFIF